jgi:hypothetical protein
MSRNEGEEDGVKIASFPRRTLGEHEPDSEWEVRLITTGYGGFCFPFLLSC